VRVAAGSALHPPQNHTQEKKNFRDSHSRENKIIKTVLKFRGLGPVKEKTEF
jgi:hypothetical protein